MKYMGSKNRIAKHLKPFLEKHLNGDNYYVKPFVGGANMIDKINYPKRIGADFNEYLILGLKYIQNELDTLPDIITEDYYKELQNKKDKNGITGFVAFSMSFGGKFFGGYRRDKAGTKGCLKNMETQTRRTKNSALKQRDLIKDVKFIHSSYQDLEIPRGSVIYCDPPYEGTTKYKDDFNHPNFWEWCREQVSLGNYVYISEYL